jgi:peptidoglycan/xylan/chitin deacetylase (PgdA/CDA1 family)
MEFGGNNFFMSILKIIETLDRQYSPTISNVLTEQPKLLSFYFHGIFTDEKEIRLDLIDPQQKFALQDFKIFFEYFLEKKYVFINPIDLPSKINISGRNILMTFDDGYFSNNLILPLLNEYKIPALFFISTNYITQQKAFWVNVLYRYRKKQGIAESKIVEEQIILKKMKHNEIDDYIIQNFGINSLKPIGDIDRAFNSTELKEFSKNQFVYLGNHTMDHVSLTNYDCNGIKEQIAGAQNTLQELVGKTIPFISFPNGDFSEEVIAISQEMGFNFGFTTIHKKNHLPLKYFKDKLMLINRFTLQSSKNFQSNLDYLRADYKILDAYLSARQKLFSR